VKYNYEDLLTNLHDGLYLVDTERRITFWNRAAELITGYSASEVVGSRCSDNILVHVDADGNSLCLSGCPLSSTMADGRSSDAEVYLHHKEGYRLPVRVRTLPLRNEKGAIVGGAEVFSDNSAVHSLAQRAQELERLSLLDPLTGLSNRRNMESELNARLQEMERFGLSFGLLFLDIDHFKAVNDTYGHDAGDLTLKTVAHTLTLISRPFDLVGRWGGEEFVGIIRNVGEEEIARIGNRYRKLIGKTCIPLPEGSIGVTVSIGATVALRDDTMESLVRRADGLMYRSKVDGRNRLTCG
jgi:diguanylate cyclase (GGDEF)-like protein/PAS domain S-box-containing protein